MPTARCPDCEMAMHPVRTDELELDRCDGCGAAWVAQAHLRARVASWSVSRLGATSSRACPGCQAEMDLVRTPGDIELDACAACDGLFFDPGELRAALDARRAPAQASVGFTCVRCGGQFPMSEGNALDAGLACGACTPQSQLTASERREANHEEIQLSDVHTFMDFVEYLFQPRFDPRRRW